MHKESLFNAAVYDGIRKTINRFRERPLFYFTEADLHSSLQSDLLQNNSKYFMANTFNGFPVSLVHLEYPTNFRYGKAQLLNGYEISLSDYKDHKTSLVQTKSYGDRGNYDLAILNREFAEYCHDRLENERKRGKDIHEKQKSEALHIINKDNARAIKRLKDVTYNSSSDEQNLPTRFQREVLYAIEFKYIHPLNARNKNMLAEIKKDNEKLKLAYYHSHGFLRPINLIFCSSIGLQRKDKQDPIVKRIKKYIEGKDTENSIKGKDTENSTKGKDTEDSIPKYVLNIFIHSFISEDKKQTPKPIVFYSKDSKDDSWVKELCKALKVDLKTKE